eukprot:2258756-Heterocapsa_arctica.AAC.1
MDTRAVPSIIAPRPEHHRDARVSRVDDRRGRCRCCCWVRLPENVCQLQCPCRCTVGGERGGP